MWAGFAINAVTGVLLFVSSATTKARQPVFYVKLALIALALVITAAIRTFTRQDPLAGGAGADPVPPRTTRLAVLSLIAWTGAIAAGRLMAYL